LLLPKSGADNTKYCKAPQHFNTHDTKDCKVLKSRGEKYLHHTEQDLVAWWPEVSRKVRKTFTLSLRQLRKRWPSLTMAEEKRDLNAYSTSAEEGAVGDDDLPI
jgi:hypothetical protein